MRRAYTAVALAGVVTLVAGGCGLPAGVDGNLTNNWAPMPAATVPVPADHACYRLFGANPDTFAQPRDPVDCTATHDVETVHVGQFTGDDGTRTTLPPVGGTGRRKAYDECAGSARTFLGDDWRAGRLQLFLTLPAEKHWDAGARWFRCDLVTFRDVYENEPETPAASLRGALTGPRPYGLGCVTVTVANDAVQSMVAANCATPHNGEFAGVFEAPDGPYPADDKARGAVANPGCLSTIAKFVGVPNDGNMKYRTGYITSAFGSQEWALGNRGTRCVIWRSSGTYSRSLRGAGAGALPVH